MRVSFVHLCRGADVDCLTINQMALQSALGSAFATFLSLLLNISHVQVANIEISHAHFSKHNVK